MRQLYTSSMSISQSVSFADARKNVSNANERNLGSITVNNQKCAAKLTNVGDGGKIIPGQTKIVINGETIPLEHDAGENVNGYTFKYGDDVFLVGADNNSKQWHVGKIGDSSGEELFNSVSGKDKFAEGTSAKQSAAETHDVAAQTKYDDFLRLQEQFYPNAINITVKTPSETASASQVEENQPAQPTDESSEPEAVQAQQVEEEHASSEQEIPANVEATVKEVVIGKPGTAEEMAGEAEAVNEVPSANMGTERRELTDNIQAINEAIRKAKNTDITIKFHYDDGDEGSETLKQYELAQRHFSKYGEKTVDAWYQFAINHNINSAEGLNDDNILRFINSTEFAVSLSDSNNWQNFVTTHSIEWSSKNINSWFEEYEASVNPSIKQRENQHPTLRTTGLTEPIEQQLATERTQFIEQYLRGLPEGYLDKISIGKNTAGESIIRFDLPDRGSSAHNINTLTGQLNNNVYYYQERYDNGATSSGYRIYVNLSDISGKNDMATSRKQARNESTQLSFLRGKVRDANFQYSTTISRHEEEELKKQAETAQPVLFEIFENYQLNGRMVIPDLTKNLNGSSTPAMSLVVHKGDNCIAINAQRLTPRQIENIQQALRAKNILFDDNGERNPAGSSFDGRTIYIKMEDLLS